MEQQAKTAEAVIEVKGMKCGDCAGKIESRLRALKGVESAGVSLADEKVTVKFDPQAAGLDGIKAEIRALGYSVDGVAAPREKKGWMDGVLYGLLPHAGCMAFIAASVLGVTLLTDLFKPLLMSRYFFYGLIALSLALAAVSSALYLRRNGQLSMDGARKRWKYLAAMFGSTIGVNLLFFFVLFPMLANFTVAQAVPVTGAVVGATLPACDGVEQSACALAGVNVSQQATPQLPQTASLQLKVDIPCSGHAALISGELKSLDGVTGVSFGQPNLFTVSYDALRTSPPAILALEVFKEYPATVINGA
ncbi:hypothetical protein COU39_01880 [Candidatus Micrarchaeota archaeon CG10_big_fil_rev_8_21_14_0_10_60_32]|nr:MAG: hypothetical protein AUJ16_02725 [Candidatus Micrarchaeota archaeon CG1_02_60_51]PIN96310.1 MAG: hypothetical protein COU39_01880 [Candidatus Micrarchaeota archaeon CG10_big_fil_rev_8_21_14_0_10_60_32]